MAGQNSAALRLTGRAWLIVAIAMLLAVLAATRDSALASSFAVTRFDDPAPDGCLVGDCSLREAIIAANSNPGPDSITLLPGMYTLSIVGTDEDAAANGTLTSRTTLS